MTRMTTQYVDQRVVLDLSRWTRLAELDEYARARGISRRRAIRELVDTGLKYWDAAGWKR